MLLEMKDINKSFANNQVLTGVSLSVDKGEILALLGLNGAGKSTLVNILCGVYTDYEGDVIFDGENLNKLDITGRRDKGIYMVPQHVAIVDMVSVGENIFIGEWPKGRLGVSQKIINEKAAEQLKQYGVNQDPKRLAGELDLVDKRKLNIIRAIFSNAKLIILDEPTTALSKKDRNELFSFVKKLAASGTSFIFISHYLDEVVEIADRVKVIRDGMGFDCEGEITEQKLAALIVGQDVELMHHEKVDLTDKEISLDVKGLCAEFCDEVSFQLRAGEIVGFVGDNESGARHTVRALMGLNPAKKGEISVRGKKLKRIPKETQEALASGLVYISNDRQKEGLCSIFSIFTNISNGILKLFLANKAGIINKSREREMCEKYFRRMNVKAESSATLVSSLSGGNQQKVVVGRALACQPEILILDEPTVGVDIHTREAIMTIVDEMAQQGKAIIYISNDFNELIRISDRFVIFKDGKISHDVKNEGMQIDELMTLRDN